MKTSKQTDAGSYVFCLVESVRAPSTRGAPEAPPGAGPVRVLPVDRRLWAIVADAPYERFSPERLELDLQDVETVSRHALAHASVVEFFFRKSPVIPLKLFTLFSEDARAQQHIRRRAKSLRALFGRLRGVEEWGVRITIDPATAERLREANGQPLSGRGYLETRKRQLNESAKPPVEMIRAAKKALDSLRGLASNVRPESFPPPGRNRPYVTGASFLVKTTKRKQWKQRVAQLTADLLAHGHRLDVSGPWPPYHFASSDR